MTRSPGARRGLLSVLLSTLALVAGLLAGPSPAGGQATGCPSVGDDFAGTGPFAVTVQEDAAHTYYSPTTLGSRGCTRHPVILWGNGTFTTPALYDGLLRHFASHGFIVAAANTSNAGSGQEMLQGLANLTSFDAQPGNRFHQRVDTQRVGTTGHSQGGAGAVRAAMDPRVDTVFSIEGATTPTGVRGPAIFFAGENDPLRTSVRSAYDAAGAIPAAYAELAGAGHLVPLGDGGGFRSAATAWARWQLMGDATARAGFVGAGCGLCDSAAWSAYEANARLDEGGGPGEPGESDCVTAANSAHVGAGRATGTLFIRAAGSGDFLGFPSTTTSLRRAGPGTWSRVTSC